MISSHDQSIRNSFMSLFSKYSPWFAHDIRLDGGNAAVNRIDNCDLLEFTVRLQTHFSFHISHNSFGGDI
jgi:hypothetical protein